MPIMRHQRWRRRTSSNKPIKASNKPDKTPQSGTERNIKSYIHKWVVKKAIHDKEGSINKNIMYWYYPKLLKQYEYILPWINQKTTKYWLKVFEQKCAYVPTDYPIIESVPTANPITEYVPYSNPVTAYVATDIYVTVSVLTDYPITTSIPTENHVTASVP